jgi:NADPH:quinone reductase-like Zn-dependent oxidoreductase
VRALAEAGVLCPLVDKTFALAQAADAHRYAESGSKRGSVVLALA